MRSSSVPALYRRSILCAVTGPGNLGASPAAQNIEAQKYHLITAGGAWIPVHGDGGDRPGGGGKMAASMGLANDYARGDAATGRV